MIESTFTTLKPDPKAKILSQASPNVASVVRGSKHLRQLNQLKSTKQRSHISGQITIQNQSQHHGDSMVFPSSNLQNMMKKKRFFDKSVLSSELALKHRTKTTSKENFLEESTFSISALTGTQRMQGLDPHISSILEHSPFKRISKKFKENCESRKRALAESLQVTSGGLRDAVHRHRKSKVKSTVRDSCNSYEQAVNKLRDQD